MFFFFFFKILTSSIAAHCFSKSSKLSKVQDFQSILVRHSQHPFCERITARNQFYTSMVARQHTSNLVFLSILVWPELTFTKLKIGISAKWLDYFLKSKHDVTSWDLTSINPHDEVEEEYQPENNDWREVKEDVTRNTDEVAQKLHFRKIISKDPHPLFTHTKQRHMVDEFLARHHRDIVEVRSKLKYKQYTLTFYFYAKNSKQFLDAFFRCPQRIIAFLKLFWNNSIQIRGEIWEIGFGPRTCDNG